MKNLTELLDRENSYLLERLERIDAVDGQSLRLNDASLREFVTERALIQAQHGKDHSIDTVVHRAGELVFWRNFLTEGAVACAMSHHAALQAVASNPHADWGLILEDDITAVVPR